MNGRNDKKQTDEHGLFDDAAQQRASAGSALANLERVQRHKGTSIVLVENGLLNDRTARSHCATERAIFEVRTIMNSLERHARGVRMLGGTFGFGRRVASGY
jgi:hypothetical protein